MAFEMLEDMERCFEGGWSDGLPVIPPYGSLVDKMLEAMGWKGSDVVGSIPSQSIEILAEQVAAAAVMAGCKTEYGRLLRAATKVLLRPEFEISGGEVTTGGVAALLIVSGPVVEELGFEHQTNALGATNRANATVGRFAQLVRLFCGRAGGVLQPHGTMGHPGRITFCIAEHPKTVWSPFHTQFGLPAEASVVTGFLTEGPNSVNNHYAESSDGVLETIASCIAHTGSTNFYWRYGGYIVAICPDHMEMIARDYTREQANRFIYEKAVQPTDELKRVGRIPREPIPKTKVEYGTMRSPMDNPGQLHIIECGAPGGRFCAVIPRWVANRVPVSQAID